MMDAMKLAAILRIKDQILTIDDCLTKLSEIADDVIIVDGESTDGTAETYKKYPKVRKVITLPGFDEGRDKNLLLDEAKKLNPDWIVWIDADEVFEKHFTRAVAEKYMRSKYNRIEFRMCNFWLSDKRCRIDGNYYLYTLHPQRSMWRNVPTARFKDQKIHNGPILGVPGPVYLSPYRIRHLGYLYKQKIDERLERCLREDPSGSRDYMAILDISRKNKTFRYREFENAQLNYLYILLYKYLANFLWILLRIWRKVKKLFNRS